MKIKLRRFLALNITIFQNASFVYILLGKNTTWLDYKIQITQELHSNKEIIVFCSILCNQSQESFL